ncbi:MAG: Dihydrolipoyllysine-residue succinyltransferase component of 2-oxoglutarate dehydrogenase complex [Alphaproteobacteria bacterium MarineAlpha5_Bin12]|nr:MAG: Dihydrolipoyllysine-residue succinyltransferase component of 2-oxoglutarate dehydrogenase complex [Alphaproteobacteria bacterium MarineAlpha5_Bin12]|tara:strand:+ start:10488 stop:11663 length:1176 start_codon:yes stop_codon:yes gene_type:complete
MTIEIKVPTLGESITEATVAKWLKKEGDTFATDEPLVEIETDKITLEVSAPSSGVLEKIYVNEGKDIKVGGILGTISEKDLEVQEISKIENNNIKNLSKSENLKKISPTAKKLIKENELNILSVSETFKEGILNKSDVIKHIENKKHNKEQEDDSINAKKNEEVVPMSNIRKRISSRLKLAQNTSAILTTFNEVDMTNIINVRENKKESFYENYGVKLGYMSFFVKAVLNALKEFPAVNAEIREENIIYKNYFNIGIAVGSETGLVVPVLKNADKMNFGEIEINISKLNVKAKEGKLSIEDLSDGTFTISNGGVYGSMLSTPIVNYPQSGILGMHNIQKRALVINDKVEIRSAMYLAFSYDHRIIDGREAVSFLILIKKLLEDPSEIILNL